MYDMDLIRPAYERFFCESNNNLLLLLIAITNECVIGEWGEEKKKGKEQGKVTCNVRPTELIGRL